LLAGCHNMGGTISDYLGAWVLESLGVTPKGEKGEGHTFDNLWIASLIATIAPWLVLATAPWLIPDVKQVLSLVLQPYVLFVGSEVVT